MIGRTYLERGQPVVVLKRWHDGRWIHRQVFGQPTPLLFWAPVRKASPRNVLILRSSGEQIVRPFRGLRKLPDEPQSQDTQGGET